MHTGSVGLVFIYLTSSSRNMNHLGVYKHANIEIGAVVNVTDFISAGGVQFLTKAPVFF